MNGNQDLNLNSTECLRTVSDFGVSRVHNICSGTVTDIPWGSADWAVTIGVCGFLLLLAILLIAIAVMMFRAEM